jgi:hypothetical protein
VSECRTCHRPSSVSPDVGSTKPVACQSRPRESLVESAIERLEAGFGADQMNWHRRIDFASAFNSIGRFKPLTQKYSASVFQKYMFLFAHPALDKRGAAHRQEC